MWQKRHALFIGFSIYRTCFPPTKKKESFNMLETWIIGNKTISPAHTLTPELNPPVTQYHSGQNPTCNNSSQDNILPANIPSVTIFSHDNNLQWKIPPVTTSLMKISPADNILLDTFRRTISPQILSWRILSGCGDNRHAVSRIIKSYCPSFDINQTVKRTPQRCT